MKNISIYFDISLRKIKKKCSFSVFYVSDFYYVLVQDVILCVYNTSYCINKLMKGLRNSIETRSQQSC